MTEVEVDVESGEKKSEVDWGTIDALIYECLGKWM